MDQTDAGGLGRFLTLADTAEMLNISLNQAYALVRSSELPAIKIGAKGQWRVERSVLESYIEAKYEETRRLGKRVVLGRNNKVRPRRLQLH
jgi:excisionase family DNA binding protein